MLKSFSHIILSFLLLAATTGMAVSKHFCDEYLISTSLYAESEPCCDDGDCCHNETAFYQVDEDFSAPSSSHIPQITDFELLVFAVEPNPENFSDKVEKSFYTERKPPPLPTIKTVLSLKQSWLL